MDTDHIDNERINGFVNSEHTVMITPRTDEAIMHCMTEHGLTFDKEKNQTLFNVTNEPLGSVNVNHLRLFVNTKDNIAFGSSMIQSKYLRILIKHYKRKIDMLSILGKNDESNTPIRIASPCMDWWVFIAPNTNPHSTVARMDLNPFTEGEFSQ
jgi:hypothetical protein